MITNDRQYKITKTQIQSFQQSLDEILKVTTIPDNIHPRIFEAQKNAIESQLQELIHEVQEYEALKEGKIIISEVNNLSELPLVLIRSRIANGLTQAELAKALELKEQQIQRYESELYNTASLKTLLKITEVLNISLIGDAQLKAIKTQELIPEFNISNYPFKEMVRRKWFGDLSSLNEAVQKSSELLFKFFDKAGLNNLQYGLTKRSIRSGSSFNEYALNAWYARVITKAKNQHLETTFRKEVITDEWLKGLAILSIDENGITKAAQYLLSSGISFIIEPSLEGTFLDGAALLIDNKKPIIALTLRHDRLDNFWFVLFHEIAHLKLHLGGDMEAIFDDLDVNSDGIESEADMFALDALIPSEVWRKSLVRFSPSKESIINQAKKLHVHPALVAGRIRRETGRFHQFNDLIGLGQVRMNFLNQSNEY